MLKVLIGIILTLGPLTYLAYSRGWYQKDDDDSPVIEPVEWWPHNAEDLGPEWRSVVSSVDPPRRMIAGHEVDSLTTIMAALTAFLLVVSVRGQDLRGVIGTVGFFVPIVAVCLAAHPAS